MTQPEAAIKVGYVRRAHGVRGAVVVRVLGDEVGQFEPGKVLATDHGEYPALAVSSAAVHKDGLLISFEEVGDRTQAEQLKGASLFIGLHKRRVLDEDEFWPEQLIGLVAVDVEGTQLGVIKETVSGIQDRLVVATDTGETEVPFVAAIVIAVDLAGGSVVVDPPEGLF